MFGGTNPAPSGSSAFGTQNNAAQGGGFGLQRSTTGLFGGGIGGSTPASGNTGLFSNTGNAGTGGPGLFGSTSTSGGTPGAFGGSTSGGTGLFSGNTSGGSGLFGGSAGGTGLFGGSQNKGTGGTGTGTGAGLFGGGSNTATGGGGSSLFGGGAGNTTPGGTGLFGSGSGAGTAGGTGLFGSTSNTGGGTGLFGSTPTGGGLFGGANTGGSSLLGGTNTFGTNTASAGGLFGGGTGGSTFGGQQSTFGQNTPGGLGQSLISSNQLAAARSSEEIELDNILEAYIKDRANPRYRFRQLIVAVAQDGEAVLQHKPQDVDASQWKEIMEEIHSMTSKDKLSPVPVLGFSAVIERAEAHREWLEKDESEHIAKTKQQKMAAERQLETETMAKIRKIRETHAQQCRRLLQVMHLLENVKRATSRQTVSQEEAKMIKNLESINKNREGVAKKVDNLLATVKIPGLLSMGQQRRAEENKFWESGQEDLFRVFKRMTDGIEKLSDVVKQIECDTDVIEKLDKNVGL